MEVLELTGPGAATIALRPDTMGSDEGELVVGVAACGICGTDLRIYRHGSTRLRYPRVLGHEIVGTVSAAPRSHRHLVGRVVVLAPPAIPCGVCGPCRRGWVNLCRSRTTFGYELDGGFASEVRVPASLVQYFEPVVVPHNVAPWFAALAEPIACCLNGSERLGATRDGWVVILGAGLIGRIHNLLARVDGAKTVVVDPDPARLEGMEADATLIGGDGDDVARHVGGVVGDDLAAIVVATSSPAAHDLAMKVGAERTRVLLFAGCSDTEKGWRVNVVHYKELCVVGSFAALPRHVAQALELLQGPLRALSDDVERIGLREVPAVLDGKRVSARPKVVVEIR